MQFCRIWSVHPYKDINVSEVKGKGPVLFSLKIRKDIFHSFPVPPQSPVSLSNLFSSASVKLGLAEQAELSGEERVRFLKVVTDDESDR